MREYVSTCKKQSGSSRDHWLFGQALAAGIVPVRHKPGRIAWVPASASDGTFENYLKKFANTNKVLSTLPPITYEDSRYKHSASTLLPAPDARGIYVFVHGACWRAAESRRLSGFHFDTANSAVGHAG